MNPILTKYARLLCSYCVDLKPGEKVYIKSTTLAEPLVREIYKEVLKLGAIPDVALDMREQDLMLYQFGEGEQLDYVPVLHRSAMESFDAYIYIKAPFNLKETAAFPVERKQRRASALHPFQQLYFKRTASLSMKRTFCLYPTLAGAQEAGMSLDDYEYFVYDACKLFEEDPQAAWLDLKARQQGWVEILNRASQIHYKGALMDIKFSTKGRNWINSHGTTNMPSGEIYTSPVEDSVEGWITFNYPLIFDGIEINQISLKVEEGLITHWDAEAGKSKLDEIFEVPGARRFGEAAIGTNEGIKRFTKNILFDEKIGGTIHMAIGQSYAQAGGQNTSSIHLDMIADMTNGGEIFADGMKIYEDGKFIC